MHLRVTALFTAVAALSALSGAQAQTSGSVTVRDAIALAPVAAPLPTASPAIPSTRSQSPLNDTDAALYREVFGLIDQGEFEAAETKAATITDRSLMGYVEFHKFFHREYTSTYEELTGWMDHYGDHPMAMRVWNLAKRKKPSGAPDPAFPSIRTAPQVAAVPASTTATRMSAAATLAGTPPVAAGSETAPSVDLTPKSARSAYNNGQWESAYKLGLQIGDHWVAGLASWRLKRYDNALEAFTFVASDPSATAWSRSGGAYWAGRAATKLGKAEEADAYFRIAASYPFTFYGLVAEERLGVEPSVVRAKKGLAPVYQSGEREIMTAALSGDLSWTNGHPKAQRVNALVQVGRANYARDEVQSGVQSASGAEERDQWLTLAAVNDISVSRARPADSTFNAALYPMPDYGVKSHADRALVYAIARKESKFNPKAKSFSGAYGLMQIMPATASVVEKDASFASNPNQLLDPSVNLRVGQKYVRRLLDSPIVDGDLLRAIGAYNAGPRPIQDAVRAVGEEDSLLLMESIPVAQTRQYVEEVAAAYWIYRQMMGKTSKTLAQAAADAPILDFRLDN